MEKPTINTQVGGRTEMRREVERCKTEKGGKVFGGNFINSSTPYHIIPHHSKQPELLDVSNTCFCYVRTKKVPSNRVAEKYAHKCEQIRKLNEKNSV